jgi:hypothetical protein
MSHSALPRRARFVGTQIPDILAFACCLVSAVFFTSQTPPLLLHLSCIAALLCLRFPQAINQIATHPWLQRISGTKIISILIGTLIFYAIALHTDPAHAQLFNKAEQQTNSIFGQYVDASIVKFMFGLLRVVVWISAVGFVLFAVYQAQRGEQWQPLMQNAFIVIAAVVIVEGLSSLFFGGGAGGGAGGTAGG